MGRVVTLFGLLLFSPLLAADDRESFTFAEWAYLRIGRDKVEVSGDLRAVRLSGELSSVAE